MKKYFYGALALPLLFACSSDDFTAEKGAAGNDQFPGIEKVDATFFMDEGATTRMATSWELEDKDLYGFAWMGDGTNVGIDGNAYQNHPLKQTTDADRGKIFKPETSIYVGKYYIYRPYDETTVSPDAIKFNSLNGQPIDDGYESSKQPWKALAKNAIIIGDKWTDVTTTGTDVDGDGKMWNIAGIDKPFKIYAAVFSNQTGLDLTYQKNNVSFAADQAITGASDIDYTIAAGTKVGAADIYGGSVNLAGAANSFTYAPTAEPNAAAHSGIYWADKKDLNNTITGAGFTFTTGAIELKAADEENGISTETANNKGWFWFNSLPVTNGSGNASTTTVTTTLNTSYGVVTVPATTLSTCAYVFEKPSATAAAEWMKVADADDITATPKEWDVNTHNTFVNQYGNHKGKYALTVDFSTGVMDGMHIKNDAQLQKLLKYYIAAGKTETGAVLNLDADANEEFKISKLSIALLQTINATVANNVLVQACGTHGTPKIIVTQDGQADLGLADAKEVPALDKVFAVATAVYLSSDCDWTWTGGEDYKTALTVDANVSSITNEGTLEVKATNVELSVATSTLGNAADATMNINEVTTVKNALTNLGTINVGSETKTSAELRAYDVEIMNDATALDACGIINNYGVVGVSETGGTSGKFNNYGLINMKNDGAITLLTSNEFGTKPFKTAFVAASNKMGTVVLPENNPTAIVSVANADANGFIKYTWPATETTYVTPTGNVKYNTIVVSGNIEFTETETEIQYIEFNGVRTQVVNPGGLLTKLKGVIVNANKSIIIEKGNKLAPSQSSFLGAGATVYNGGTFTHSATVSGKTASNYFGEWSTDQIVKY